MAVEQLDTMATDLGVEHLQYEHLTSENRKIMMASTSFEFFYHVMKAYTRSEWRISMEKLDSMVIDLRWMNAPTKIRLPTSRRL